MKARTWLDSIESDCDPEWKNDLGQTFKEFCKLNPWWNEGDFL